jgi:hypothetical protein
MNTRWSPNDDTTVNAARNTVGSASAEGAGAVGLPGRGGWLGRPVFQPLGDGGAAGEGVAVSTAAAARRCETTPLWGP